MVDGNDNKIIEILSEIRGDIRLINEKIKEVDSLSDRVSILERNESRNEGRISGIRFMITIFGFLVVGGITWIYQTTYKNDTALSILLQRVDNIENILHDIRK